MKKISTFLIMIMVLVLPFISVVHADEEKKITIYMFRGEGCPHCEEAIEFFDELSKDEEYGKLYELKKYEVWYDEDNSKLMEKVADALGEDVSGVPFIIIGDKTFKGYASSMDEEIKTAIKEQYSSDSYKDYVKSIESGKKLIKTDSKNNAYIPIIVVSVVALLTVIGLVFFTKEK